MLPSKAGLIIIPLVWHQATRFETALNAHCEVAGAPVLEVFSGSVVPYPLEDTHERGAWLSAREPAPVLVTRHERDMVNVLGQFATELGLACGRVRCEPESADREGRFGRRARRDALRSGARADHEYARRRTRLGQKEPLRSLHPGGASRRARPVRPKDGTDI